MPGPRGTQLRPRSFGEILDGGVRIWRDHLRVLFPFVAIILFPFQIVSALLVTSAGDPLATNGDLATTGATATPEFTWTQIAALLSGLVLGLVSSLLVAAALTSFIGEAVLGRDPDTRSARTIALHRFWPSLGTLLVTVLVMAAVIVVVVLGALIHVALAIVLGLAAVVGIVWWAIAIGFAAPIVVLEHAGPIRAIRRSILLVRGRWWMLFGITIVSGLMTGIPTAIVSGLITLVLGLFGGGNATFDFMWSAIGGTIGAALFTPMASAITVLAYLDQRVRKEGFDLQRLATSLGTEVPPMPSPTDPLAAPAEWGTAPPPWSPPPAGPCAGPGAGPGAPPTPWSPPPPAGPDRWAQPQPSTAPLPPPPTAWPAPPVPSGPPAPGTSGPAAPRPDAPPPLDTPPGMWAPPPGSAAPGSATPSQGAPDPSTPGQGAPDPSTPAADDQGR